MSATNEAAQVFTAIGLMSGTSMDGIDAAIIQTDGLDHVEIGASLTVPYRGQLGRKLRRLVMDQGRNKKAAKSVERDLTLAHVEVVERLLAATGFLPAAIDLIGFHGHTVVHTPEQRSTWQIGDGELLAQRTGIAVVSQFRSADVAAGGQGAPLVPLYHAARAAQLEKPIAVLNIGGVANVTWLGADGAVIAFDCGPGNAMIDDFVLQRTGRPYDAAGALSLSGAPNEEMLALLLDHAYFRRTPPKSLDRNQFDVGMVNTLSTQDGAATLAAFTVRAAAGAILAVGAPRGVLVCGGGRLNRALMAGLTDAMPGVAVAPVESVGWRGDSLEAEAFGYLAVRSMKGLPLSLPTTTGVPEPLTGGMVARPVMRAAAIP
jgi:anhydro-N-acetylmuramic acid kinase